MCVCVCLCKIPFLVFNSFTRSRIAKNNCQPRCCAKLPEDAPYRHQVTLPTVPAVTSVCLLQHNFAATRVSKRGATVAVRPNSVLFAFTASCSTVLADGQMCIVGLPNCISRLCVSDTSTLLPCWYLYLPFSVHSRTVQTRQCHDTRNLTVLVSLLTVFSALTSHIYTAVSHDTGTLTVLVSLLSVFSAFTSHTNTAVCHDTGNLTVLVSILTVFSAFTCHTNTAVSHDTRNVFVSDDPPLYVSYRIPCI